MTVSVKTYQSKAGNRNWAAYCRWPSWEKRSLKGAWSHQWRLSLLRKIFSSVRQRTNSTRSLTAVRWDTEAKKSHACNEKTRQNHIEDVEQRPPTHLYRIGQIRECFRAWKSHLIRASLSNANALQQEYFTTFFFTCNSMISHSKHPVQSNELRLAKDSRTWIGHEIAQITNFAFLR